jgi:outer membrane receptor for ferrienterochelin and colicin
MRRLFHVFVLIIACAPLLRASEPADETNNTTAEGNVATARELSEGLIYSVDRVPERTFDTARAVEMITISELWRKSGMSLVDVLQHEAGVAVVNVDGAGGVPLMRGLLGKQVMVLIDGVKVNDTMWRADLSDHGFADSIRATAYFNRQQDNRLEIRTVTPGTNNLGSETDNLLGLNLELGVKVITLQ